MEIITVNVKTLAPPEPMTVIIRSLAQLTDGQCLLVSHRRQPFPLYEKLVEAGWGYHCQVNDDDDVSLYIYKQTDYALFKQLVCQHKLV